MFIFNPGSPESRGNHSLVQIQKPWNHLTCVNYSSRSKLAHDAFMFHLSLADLNKKYRNEIEIDKK